MYDEISSESCLVGQRKGYNRMGCRGVRTIRISSARPKITFFKAT